MAFSRFQAATRGQLAEFLKKERRAGAKAWTDAVRETAAIAKTRWRASLRRNGLGGFEKAVRDQTFPSRGVSLRAASEVFSKAVYKRAGGSFDMLDAYEQGATIRPQVGDGFVWIPEDDVPRRPARGGSTRKAQPSDYPGLLRFFTAPGTGLAFAALKSTGEVIFVGVKEVRVKPRPLGLQHESELAAADLDARAVRNWEAETKKAGIAA